MSLYRTRVKNYPNLSERRMKTATLPGSASKDFRTQSLKSTLKVARHRNEKDRWTTLPSQGCFVLTRDKAHSAAERKKNLKVIYSVGASSFPVNPETAAEQASRQTSPALSCFSLQGRDFYLLFSLGCWSTKLNLLEANSSCLSLPI